MNPQSPFMQIVRSGRPPSIIFWGPPGVGKTTLAQIIAQQSGRPFRQLSAVQSGVKEVREVLEFGKRQPGTILFIDEIHRFNKSQQDSLLGAVEKGIVTLIGATTENPSFEVNSALLSRCQVYTLDPLGPEAVETLVKRAVETDPILSARKIQVEQSEAIWRMSGGDARRALTLLELAVNSFGEEEEVRINDEVVMSAAQTHIALYDKAGEQHYDLISAFIKSLRGSDPQAAVYWLARMLDGGEDPGFIARRMVILASEDVGNANPNALLLATACYSAVEMIGMPEARIILAQAATYLAASAKSNAAYGAIEDALALVRQDVPRPVPLHLRNAATSLMKNMGYGKDYKYSHSFHGQEGNQEFMPPGLEGRCFYQPKPIGNEAKLREYLKQQWGDKYPLP